MAEQPADHHRVGTFRVDADGLWWFSDEADGSLRARLAEELADRPGTGPFCMLVAEGGHLLLVSGSRPADGGEVVGRIADAGEDVRRIVSERVADAVAAVTDSRGRIEQAKGALMLAYGLDAEQAFARLVWQSKQTNVKLRDIADRIVAGLAERPAMSATDRARFDEVLHALPKDPAGRLTTLSRLAVDQRRVEAALVLAVRGDVDLATGAEFEHALTAARRHRGPGPVVVDLTGVVHLGSMGGRLLARCERHCAREGVPLLVVATADGPVARVLSVAMPGVELHRDIPTAVAAGA